MVLVSGEGMTSRLVGGRERWKLEMEASMVVGDGEGVRTQGEDGAHNVHGFDGEGEGGVREGVFGEGAVAEVGEAFEGEGWLEGVVVRVVAGEGHVAVNAVQAEGGQLAADGGDEAFHHEQGPPGTAEGFLDDEIVGGVGEGECVFVEADLERDFDRAVQGGFAGNLLEAGEAGAGVDHKGLDFIDVVGEIV